MQLDAPSVELENYHTHKVGYIADKIEMDPAAEKEKRRRLRWLRVQFKKPIL